jgi:DNA invertase Pin-like site-specific DNA recombinase
MRFIGYIRTSTVNQLTDRQVLQLKEVCDEYFIEDGVSAVNKHRPVYHQVIEQLQLGDTFVVLSLDRAFRSVVDALQELDKMQNQGVHFKSLTQNFDTGTPDGNLLYTIAAALAEWERSILIMRTKEGMEAARQRGQHIGRPPKLDDKQIEEAKRLLENEVYSSLTQLAGHFRVHERTIARALNKAA